MALNMSSWGGTPMHPAYGPPMDGRAAAQPYDQPNNGPGPGPVYEPSSDSCGPGQMYEQSDSRAPGQEYKPSVDSHRPGQSYEPSSDSHAPRHAYEHSNDSRGPGHAYEHSSESRGPLHVFEPSNDSHGPQHVYEPSNDSQGPHHLYEPSGDSQGPHNVFEPSTDSRGPEQACIPPPPSDSPAPQHAYIIKLGVADARAPFQTSIDKVVLSIDPIATTKMAQLMTDVIQQARDVSQSCDYPTALSVIMESVDPRLLSSEALQTAIKYSEDTNVEQTDAPSNNIKSEAAPVSDEDEGGNESNIDDNNDNIDKDTSTEKQDCTEKADDTTETPQKPRKRKIIKKKKKKPLKKKGRIRPYECGLCFKSFRKLVECRQHAAVHREAGEANEVKFEVTVNDTAVPVEGKMFPCNLCGKSFNNNKARKRHARIHLGIKPFECTHCSQRFSRKCYLTNHIRTHTGEKPYPCMFCSKRFAQASYAKIHIAKHCRSQTPKQHRPYPCTICNKRFSRADQVVVHMNEHCDESERNNMEMMGSGEGQVGSRCRTCDKVLTLEDCTGVTGEAVGKCLECHRLYPDPGWIDGEWVSGVVPPLPALREAIRQRSKCQSQTLGEYKANQNEENGNAASTPSFKGPILCPICDEEFHNLAVLKTHLRTHTGEEDEPSPKEKGKRRIHIDAKPLECSACKKVFYESATLRRHVVGEIKETPFQCHVCQQQFGCTGGLGEHMNTHPEAAKLYQCAVCQKKFKAITTLIEHGRIHSGEKPYSCNQCEKKFTQYNGLKLHLRWHSGEKPHECPVCKKAFAMSCHLKEHMRRHTGEKLAQCNHCGIRLASNRGLKRHILIHTGEKPYQCNICGVQFARLDKLRMHMKQHSGGNDMNYQGQGHMSAGNMRPKVHHPGKKMHHIPEKTHPIPEKTQHMLIPERAHQNMDPRIHPAPLPAHHIPEKTIHIAEKMHQMPPENIHHFGDVNRYLPCNLCSRQFLRPDELETHMKQHDIAAFMDSFSLGVIDHKF